MTESLGPKPTSKQMETLKKLCQPNAVVHYSSGTRPGSESCWLVFNNDAKSRESFRMDVLHKFRTWGWLEAFGDPAWAWRGNEYRITDKGRKVVETGVIRK